MTEKGVWTSDDIARWKAAIEAGNRERRRCVLQELVTIGAATLAVVIVIALVVGAWFLMWHIW